VRPREDSSALEGSDCSFWDAGVEVLAPLVVLVVADEFTGCEPVAFSIVNALGFSISNRGPGQILTGYV
jgi:hypothetical protein